MFVNFTSLINNANMTRRVNYIVLMKMTKNWFLPKLRVDIKEESMLVGPYLFARPFNTLKTLHGEMCDVELTSRRVSTAYKKDATLWFYGYKLTQVCVSCNKSYNGKLIWYGKKVWYKIHCSSLDNAVQIVFSPWSH